MARHGNTAWTHSGQYRGLNDLPLTPDGERNALRLGERRKEIGSMTTRRNVVRQTYCLID